jgi:hypothetical protein
MDDEYGKKYVHPLDIHFGRFKEGCAIYQRKEEKMLY